MGEGQRSMQLGQQLCVLLYFFFIDEHGLYPCLFYHPSPHSHLDCSRLCVRPHLHGGHHPIRLHAHAHLGICFCIHLHLCVGLCIRALPPHLICQWIGIWPCICNCPLVDRLCLCLHIRLHGHRLVTQNLNISGNLEIDLN